MLKVNARVDHCCLHFGQSTPDIYINVINCTVTDVQDGRVDKVRTIFQTAKKLVVRKIEFVFGVALG